MARLYVDEQLPRIVSELLQAMEHDVLTVQEAGNLSWSATGVHLKV